MFNDTDRWAAYQKMRARLEAHWIINQRGRLQKVDVITAAKWAADFNSRVVHKTKIENVEVSTIFLMIDHSHDSNGPPILFETMVFGGDYDGYRERYSSLGQAKKGHWAIVQNLRKGERPHPDYMTTDEFLDHFNDMFEEEQ